MNFVLIINIFFIFFSFLFTYTSFIRVIKYSSRSISDYVILLIFVFNCLPVFIDVFFGKPQYVYYYRVFGDVIDNEDVCLVYNIYILITLLSLQLYANNLSHNLKIASDYKITFSFLRKKNLDIIFILLPIIYVVVKYGIDIFSGYTTLSRRNIEDGDSRIINQMIILSVYLYVTRFYSRTRTKKDLLILFSFFLILIWLNGKRYIIVTIGEVIFYLYQMTNIKSKKRINLFFVVEISIIFIVFFSIYYLSNIKVTSASEYMYGTLRVDFGRDDVVKYVIKQVLFDKRPILDYTGQSLLADIFIFVPRSIWPNKPYPHYRYLTASILGVDISNIPSGTTPSIFEMNICNFSWFGMPITIIVLLILCYLADNTNELREKVVYLLILTNLLTQALDAIMILIPVLVIIIMSKHANFSFLKKKKIAKMF
ncbi:MAG: hypothetical protein II969_17225 [Anaerolineaceae bacterium]|nr:hypothetical protein [Anaerolineaceae bacterium]